MEKTSAYIFKYKINTKDAVLFSERLQTYLNFETRVKRDIIFVKNTPQSRNPFKIEFLERKFELNLSKENSIISDSLFSTIDPNFTKAFKKASKGIIDPLKTIRVPAQLGDVSNSELAHLRLTFAFDEKAIKNAIKEDVLPFITSKKIGAKFVLPISCDLKFARFLSITKMGQIIKQSTFSGAQKDLDRGAYQGINLDVFSPLKLVNAMTRLYPFCFTLPFTKDNVAWHFYLDGIWTFPNLFMKSFLDTFTLLGTPRGEKAGAGISIKIPKTKAPEIWSFLSQLIYAVNNYFSFLFDPKNFLNENLEVNLLKQIKALDLTELLIADLQVVNFNTDFHQRICFSFLALDKIANLKKSLFNLETDEPIIFQNLFGQKQKELNDKIIEEDLEPNREHLKKFLKNINQTCYSKINEDLERQFLGKVSEIKKLERIRYLRNLHHGTHLRKEQYESLFSKGKAFVPDYIGFLPFLLIFCLLLNPEKFLAFDPNN